MEICYVADTTLKNRSAYSHHVIKMCDAFSQNNCKVTLRIKGNKVYEFYAVSYTWLKSKETYLICSLEKNNFIPLKNSLSAVNFLFSKVTGEKDNHKKAINALNAKLSERDISEISVIQAEAEILITVKI